MATKGVKKKTTPSKGEVVATELQPVASKFYLTPTSPLTDKQILKIFGRTPKQYIYKRPAKGGGEWEYVKGSYITKVLNYVFGFMWDFEVVETKEAHGQIVVHGRLTVNYMDKEGVVRKLLTKDQYGRADIKYKKDTDIALDYGNDHKAATTDALKKCASALGIAGDIYASEEFKDIESETVTTNQAEPITEEQIKALTALGIDHSVIKTKQEALAKIEEIRKQKAGGAK